MVGIGVAVAEKTGKSEGVAAFIAAKVGDVGRPRSTVRPTRALEHLPGESGLLAGFRNLAGWKMRGNAHLLEQRARYGVVYRHAFGRSPIVCVSDPGLLSLVTRNEQQVFSAALAWASLFQGIDPTREVIDSPGTLDFQPHRDARRLLQPAFSGPAIASYVGMATEAYERAVAQWVEQGHIDFKPEVRRLFAHVSGRVFIGVADEAEGAMLDRALADAWRGSMAWSKHPSLSPTWRKAMLGHKILRETLLGRVAQRRKTGGSDLFSRMCSTATDVEWLDDDVLVRLFIGVLSGAFDTSSSAATSMAYLLTKHPEWQERLRAESASVGRGALSFEDSKRLQAYDWVLKESLRLFPPAPFLPRQCLRDVSLGGYDVPAGALVFALIGPVLQAPEWWSNPSSFDPERFSEARAEDKRHKGSFLPFGAGPHTCIGAQLAAFEIKAFFHALLSRCRLRLAPDYTAHHQILPIGIATGQVRVALERL